MKEVQEGKALDSETHRNPERQEFEVEVISVEQRIAAIKDTVAILKKLVANLDVLEAKFPRSYEAMKKLTMKPARVEGYLATDALRSQINALVDRLNTFVPEGQYPIEKTLAADVQKIHEVTDMARRHQANMAREKLGIHVPYEQHVGEELQRTVAEYAQKVDRGREDILHSIESSADKWSQMLRAYEQLGLVEERGSSDIERRSVSNMRHFVAEYIQAPENSSSDMGEILQRIEKAAENESSDMMLAYYRQPEGLAAILAEGRLRSLFELDESQQKTEKKSNRSIEEVSRDRRRIESALGWPEGAPVYHLTTENTLDEQMEIGAHTNYGSVQAVFDFDALSRMSTFTLGDSLNDVGVPMALKGYLKKSKVESAVARQITREHVPMAKALLRLASQDDIDPLKMQTRYLEAQVGGVSGVEIFSHLKEIVVRETEFMEELRSAGDKGRDRALAGMEEIKKYCKDNNIPLRIIA